MPLKGGIYFVEVNFGIAYVGQAKNLRSRWKSHERLAEIKALYQEAFIRYLVVEDPDERNRMEATLNKHFNPPWDGRVWRRVEESRWGKLSKWEWFGYPIEVFKNETKFAYRFFAPYDPGSKTSNSCSFSTHREALEAAKEHIELEYTSLSAERWIEESVNSRLITVQLHDTLCKILPPLFPGDFKSPLEPFSITRDVWELETEGAIDEA
ncbi:GIY-YIG nuclease family protein [Trichocoleus sp. FACHB-591]|uniref:GIY-YIG nuclease family protein n=1 Tax=Trichocoleus sp. FACHB-591 TaxID=2692872 RepID=UPI001682E3A3|nr:GIY-YIG nuclease family protein [Trichocoleus sp. FACHB-591]MBD2093595.1 GIY-YIG nuclease family protein [Trichocoleus sp. FACHB-591]